jgi:hypothetical protein
VTVRLVTKRAGQLGASSPTCLLGGLQGVCDMVSGCGTNAQSFQLPHWLCDAACALLVCMQTSYNQSGSSKLCIVTALPLPYHTLLAGQGLPMTG